MIKITEQPIDAAEFIAAVNRKENGGLAVFLGTVRDFTGPTRLAYMEYDAYKEMAEKKMAQIVEEARARWDTPDIAVAHRFGRLELDRAQRDHRRRHTSPRRGLRGLQIRHRPHKRRSPYLEERGGRARAGRVGRGLCAVRQRARFTLRGIGINPQRGRGRSCCRRSACGGSLSKYDRGAKVIQIVKVL